MNSSERQKQLLEDLQALHRQMRDETFAKYHRINPFTEDLFPWQERGAFWTREDKNITIYNSTSVVGDVEIGANTWVGPFCSLDGTGGLSIGSFCSIAAGCQLVTHDTVRWALSGGKDPYDRSPISIGDCCFIGSHAIILRGVTIGDRCVISAGSVVNKDVPSYSVVRGNPAQIVGRTEIVDGRACLLIDPAHR